MAHTVDNISSTKASVTITCECGAKFTGQSYRSEHNALNEREALAKFRSHNVKNNLDRY